MSSRAFGSGSRSRELRLVYLKTASSSISHLPALCLQGGVVGKASVSVFRASNVLWADGAKSLQLGALLICADFAASCPCAGSHNSAAGVGGRAQRKADNEAPWLT